jgi:hypothetical protein
MRAFTSAISAEPQLVEGDRMNRRPNWKNLRFQGLFWTCRPPVESLSASCDAPLVNREVEVEVEGGCSVTYIHRMVSSLPIPDRFGDYL